MSHEIKVIKDEIVEMSSKHIRCQIMLCDMNLHPGDDAEIIKHHLVNCILENEFLHKELAGYSMSLGIGKVSLFCTILLFSFIGFIAIFLYIFHLLNL